MKLAFFLKKKKKKKKKMIKTFLKIIWNRKRLRGLLETYPESLKDNISQMVLSLIPFLWMFEIEKNIFLMESLKRQHESKFARKIGKCNVFIFKDSLSQIMLSLIQLLKYIWENGMSLWWNFIKALNWQYGPNRIVPDAVYLRNLGKLKNIGA